MSGTQRPYSLQRFQSAFLHFLMGRAAQAVAMVAFTLLSVRLLSTREFAAYMIFFGLVEACRPLSSLGLVPVIQQFLPDLALHGSTTGCRRFLRLTLLVRLILTGGLVIACYLGWGTLGIWLGFESAEMLPVGLVCGVLLASLMADYSITTLEALLQQHLAQPLRTMLSIGKLVALVVLFFFGLLDVVTLLQVELCIAGICAFLGELAVARSARALRPDGSKPMDVRAILSFAWHMSGAQFLATAANPGVLRVVAARTLGLESSAHFAFLQQLVLYTTRFLPSIQFANLVRPMLVARQSVGSGEAVARICGLLWKLNAIFAVGLVCFAGIGGDRLLQLLSGNRVEHGGWALLLMLLVPAFIAQENLASTVLQVYRRAHVVRVLNLLSLLVPLFVASGAVISGLTGAAAGVAIGIGLQSTLSLVIAARTDVGITLAWQGVLRTVTAAAVFSGLISASTAISSVPGSVPVLALLLLTGIAYLILLVTVVRPLTLGEFGLIERLLGQRAEVFRLLVKR